MTRPKKKSSRSAGSVDYDIGDRIRAARHARGVTQQDLAAMLGVTFQQIQKYESGANRVAASRLINIAKALDLAVTEFLPAAGAHSEMNLNTPELAKLIGLYLRLSASDQRRMLDYGARLADGK